MIINLSDNKLYKIWDKMKKLAKILTVLALLFSVCACSNDPIDKKISEAFKCLMDDNHEKARQIGDNLLRNYYPEMTLEQKCDLAVLYCCVYYEIEDDADLDKFVMVFKDTMKTPQAARKYYKRVYGEEIYDMLQEYKSLGVFDEELDALEKVWDEIW